jgi:hypothetical protein
MTRDLLATLALAGGMALAGVAFGIVYFTALRRSVSLYCEGRGRLGPVALTLGRLAAAALLLGLAAGLGAVPLLASFLGFFAARVIALRAISKKG